MATTYIALTRMKVGTDLREAGDPVPEAADWTWQTIEHYLRNGRLLEMDTDGTVLRGGDRHRMPASTAPQLATAPAKAAKSAK